MDGHGRAGKERGKKGRKILGWHFHASLGRMGGRNITEFSTRVLRHDFSNFGFGISRNVDSALG